MKTPRPFCAASRWGVLIFLLCAGTLPAALLVQSGQTIAFMGDSITQQGTRSPSGYVRLVESGLKANGIEVKVVGAGVGGHKPRPSER